MSKNGNFKNLFNTSQKYLLVLYVLLPLYSSCFHIAILAKIKETGVEERVLRLRCSIWTMAFTGHSSKRFKVGSVLIITYISIVR